MKSIVEYSEFLIWYHINTTVESTYMASGLDDAVRQKLQRFKLGIQSTVGEFLYQALR